MSLFLELREFTDALVELRASTEKTLIYESRKLEIAAISDLVAKIQRDYYVRLPQDYATTGQKLYRWLDGPERWLTRAIAQCSDSCLVLAIEAAPKLAYLPWELLHDGQGFLVGRISPAVVPLRWRRATVEPYQAPPRHLKVLFMATDPEGVTPKLDFEREEGEILRQTQGKPLEVRVEESGCIEELTKVWGRSLLEFDVFHLTGHASIDEQPYFITESLTGDRQETCADDLARAFQFRWCPLIFLSGCRTGEAANAGAVPSFAEQLLERGARAVLAWGRPVADRDATAAAAHLYDKLADGYRLPEALASTYQQLLKENSPYWHLLRLYGRGTWPEALVEPPPYLPWQPSDSTREQFLDPETQRVRVAVPQEFVGRRRELQRALRALRGRSLALLIHGLGGAGKSTLAARLLERRPEYDAIVFYRQLDEGKLLDALARQCLSERGLESLSGKLPLMNRLTQFLQEGLNKPEQRFIFVLDDFEANLEERGGEYLCRAEVAGVLRDLLEAVERSRLPHRVLITSRYDFALPAQSSRYLERLALGSLRGADLEKKYQRLAAFNGEGSVEAELQERAKYLADGNPRLLEWLNAILADETLPLEEILEQLAAKALEFREQILAQALLELLPQAVRDILQRGRVFRLPVPKVVFEEVCCHPPHPPAPSPTRGEGEQGGTNPADFPPLASSRGDREEEQGDTNPADFPPLASSRGDREGEQGDTNPDDLPPLASSRGEREEEQGDTNPDDFPPLASSRGDREEEQGDRNPADFPPLASEKKSKGIRILLIFPP